MPSLDDVVDLDAVIPKPKPHLLDDDVQKGRRAIDRVLSASDAELNSRAFLLSQFKNFGLPLVTADFFKPWAAHMNASGFGALQVPTEYIDMLRTIMPLNLETGIEIGVYRGGFSYFTTAVLQRVNPRFTLTLVDPWDSMLGFDQFAAVLNLRKLMPSTSQDFAGQRFDFVFIDGDHTYEGAIADWRNLGVHAARAVGFHDIHDHTPGTGTAQTWNEIKAQVCETHEVYEFAHAVERGLGIGLVVNPSGYRTLRQLI